MSFGSVARRTLLAGCVLGALGGAGLASFHVEDANACTACGGGWREYYDFYCDGDGVWHYALVGVAEYPECGPLYPVVGEETDCWFDTRYLGGGGEDTGQCLASSLDDDPHSCDLPSTVCADYPDPVGHPDNWWELVAVADGAGGSETSGDLHVDGAVLDAFIALEGQDRIVATLDGVEQVLALEQQPGQVRYVARFDTAREDSEYTFELELPSGTASSAVSLPPELTLERTAEAFSRGGDDLEVSWSPSADEPIRIGVTGDCIQPYSTEIEEDLGSFILARGTLAPLDDRSPAECEVEVVVERRRSGTIDPGFGDGGTAFGIQRRSVTVYSSP